MRTLMYSLACLLGLFAAGCAAGPRASGAADISGIEWQLAALGPSAVPGESGILLQLDGAGKAAGSGGVNRFFATWNSAGPGRIEFADIGSTKMAGPRPAMDLESRYFDTLSRVAEYRTSGDRLELLAGGEVVATFQRAR